MVDQFLFIFRDVNDPPVDTQLKINYSGLGKLLGKENCEIKRTTQPLIVPCKIE